MAKPAIIVKSPAKTLLRFAFSALSLIHILPQNIRDRVRNEDLVDFRLNYSFEQAEGYYETNRSNAIELYSKVSKLYDNEGNFSG